MVLVGKMRSALNLQPDSLSLSWVTEGSDNQG